MGIRTQNAEAKSEHIISTVSTLAMSFKNFSNSHILCNHKLSQQRKCYRKVALSVVYSTPNQQDI